MTARGPFCQFKINRPPARPRPRHITYVGHITWTDEILTMFCFGSSTEQCKNSIVWRVYIFNLYDSSPSAPAFHPLSHMDSLDTHQGFLSAAQPTDQGTGSVVVGTHFISTEVQFFGVWKVAIFFGKEVWKVGNFFWERGVWKVANFSEKRVCKVKNFFWKEVWLLS